MFCQSKKQNIFIVVCLLTTFVATACSIQVGRTNIEVTSLGNEKSLSSEKGFFITLPEDFVLGEEKEVGSGTKTQTALRKALISKNIPVLASEKNIGIEDAFSQAKLSEAAYLVSVKITLWDDPPSFLQQRPDKGQVLVSVYDVESGELLRMDRVECNSIPTLINHVGGGGPEDCLQDGFENWATRFVIATP